MRFAPATRTQRRSAVAWLGIEPFEKRSAYSAKTAFHKNLCIDQKTGLPIDYDPTKDIQVYSGVQNQTLMDRQEAVPLA
jgi:hypothetical protein